MKSEIYPNFWFFALFSKTLSVRCMYPCMCACIYAVRIYVVVMLYLCMFTGRLKTNKRTITVRRSAESWISKSLTRKQKKLAWMYPETSNDEILMTVKMKNVSMEWKNPCVLKCLFYNFALQRRSISIAKIVISVTNEYINRIFDFIAAYRKTSHYSKPDG